MKEQEEMQEVNEQLLAELERRDQALDEAVGVIVNLEDKVDRMEKEMVRSVEETPYIPGEDFSSSPPDMSDMTPRRNVVRMPSFLSEQSEHTEALRSLYLPNNHSFSETSLPKLDEEPFDQAMYSPSLSVLSESSFLSVYGEKNFDLNAEPENPKRHRASSSVEKWIDDRPAQSTTPPRGSPELLRRKQFISINDVLESPLQRLEKLKHTLEKHRLPEHANYPVTLKDKRKDRRELKNVFTDKKSFEIQQSLPPTPDTFSTNTLRHYKGSNDTLAPDGTFLSTTSTFTTGITYNNHQSALSMRPRSAGETVTSRREGHGWDTETQGDITETGSTSSTYSPSAVYEPIKRVLTPELFNFGTSGPDRDWGRDTVFNHNQPESDLPLHKHYNNLRRSSMIDSQHPRSDDTVMQYNGKYADSQRQSTATPSFDTSPRPDPPDRRSSLSAVAKLRRSSTSQNQHSPTTSPTKDSKVQLHITAPTPISKTSRLASRLFGGSRNVSSSISEQPPQNTNPTAPIAKTEPSKSQPQTIVQSTSTLPRLPRPTYTTTSRSQISQYNHLDAEIDRASATPPPIRRSKTSNTNPTSRMRPTSAGIGSGAVKRLSGFGGDGAFDDEQREIGGNMGAGKKRRESLSVDLGVARGLGAILGVDIGGDGEGEGKKKWFRRG